MHHLTDLHESSDPASGGRLTAAPKCLAPNDSALSLVEAAFEVSAGTQEEDAELPGGGPFP